MSPFSLTLRQTLSLLCLFLFLATARDSALAACPTGRISLFLPTPHGGQVERLYTPLPDSWNAAFHSRISLIPKPGLGGSQAVNALSTEKSDGCFLSAIQYPSFLFLAQTADSMYTEKTLASPLLVAALPNALWVAEGSPLRSVADLVRQARGGAPVAMPKIAGVGRYTDQHLAALQLDRMAGIRTLYLPLLGSAECRAAVLDGQADACWGYALGPESMPGMRVLAVAGETRSPVLPDVPTFRELDMDVVNVACFGLGIPANSSAWIRNELERQLATLMRDPALQSRFISLGVTPLDPASSAAYLPALRQNALQLLEDYPLIPPHLRRPPELQRIAATD